MKEKKRKKRRRENKWKKKEKKKERERKMWNKCVCLILFYAIYFFVCLHFFSHECHLYLPVCVCFVFYLLVYCLYISRCGYADLHHMLHSVEWIFPTGVFGPVRVWPWHVGLLWVFILFSLCTYLLFFVCTCARGCVKWYLLYYNLANIISYILLCLVHRVT